MIIIMEEKATTRQVQKVYEKLNDKKDWKNLLTKAEGLIEDIIPEADTWDPWS